MDDLTPYSTPDTFIDADHPEIIDYSREHAGTDPDPVAQAVHLYYVIRDDFRYNPWNVKFDPRRFKASAFLARGAEEGGHCIDKACLLAACARARGIPARLHFANVRNHIGVHDVIKLLGTDLLVFHGYTEFHLQGQWVAATPAFNKELCDYLGVDALEFDGRHSSIFQQYDKAGGRFMEYVHDYGPFNTIPYDFMISEWKKHYGFNDESSWPLRR